MNVILYIIALTVIVLKVMVKKHFVINGLIKGNIVNKNQEKNIIFL